MDHILFADTPVSVGAAIGALTLMILIQILTIFEKDKEHQEAIFRQLVLICVAWLFVIIEVIYVIIWPNQ